MVKAVKIKFNNFVCTNVFDLAEKPEIVWEK